ncbi:LuxR C-terminal-related transcriptional regulator [Streptomyces sp. NPDC051677]|uniref:LuxR C-terminal-related transcriptional regulator n=1 Tax=Streptomyces sp. NPDC051677 TaxID=3365669 RepID=UPI0037D119B6
MSVDLMRPDDIALLKQTSREVRRVIRGAVAFGGLNENGKVRITAVSGAEHRTLTSIVLAPSRGLGGRSWQIGKPLSVEDYATADEITHDFDSQILGEGIVSLAVAPIIVRQRMRGLLYLGTRSPSRSPDAAGFLESQARRIAHELNIRDQVDDRLRLLRAAESAERTAPADLGQIHARLREIAHRVPDPLIAAELRELAAPAKPTDGHGAADGLTARQVDTLALVGLGLKNAEIAARLGLSVPTVKGYLRQAMARMHAPTRQAAVVEARRRGLLP